MVNRVVFTVRVYPEDTEVNLKDLQKRIEQKFPGEKILRSSEEPIAFGLVSLIIDITAPEEEGVSDRYETGIKEVEGVSEIQVESVRRLTKV